MVNRNRTTVDRRRIKGGDLDPVYNAGGTTGINLADNGLFDAFARLRTSDPFTVFDSKQVFDDPDIANSVENFPILFDNQEVSGSGTSTLFNVNRASTTLGVSANTAGRRVRQSRRRINYQPSKSQSLTITFVDIHAASGITKRIGYYDDNNGVYLQGQNGILSVGIRSNVTGTPTDTLIPQSSWDVDKLDGFGESGFELHPTKSQILTIDFEWLGAGRVRYGFFLDGLPIYAHYVDNANELDSVYMSTPNNPIRAEIINDGTGPAATFEHICTSVGSEGGVQPNGIFRAPPPSSVAATSINANTVGTTYVVAAIRLKPQYFGAEVAPERLSLLATTLDDFIWSLHLNPTFSSALTWTDIPHSAIQYAYGPTTNPGTTLTNPGYVFDSGLVSSNVEQELATTISDYRMGASIAGVSDILALAVTPLAINLDILGLMTWREVW